MPGGPGSAATPATAACTKDRAHRQHQALVGEGWRLGLLRAHQKITADHNATYLGTNSPVWTARHVILLELARGRSARKICGKHHIPIALRCGAAAKVLRVVAAHLRLYDPRRRLKARVIDWPKVGRLPRRGPPALVRRATSTPSAVALTTGNAWDPCPRSPVALMGPWCGT